MSAAQVPVFWCARCGHMLGTEPNTDYPEALGVIRLLKLCACDDDHECAAEMTIVRPLQCVRLDGYRVREEPHS